MENLSTTFKHHGVFDGQENVAYLGKKDSGREDFLGTHERGAMWNLTRELGHGKANEEKKAPRDILSGTCCLENSVEEGNGFIY